MAWRKCSTCKNGTPDVSCNHDIASSTTTMEQTGYFNSDGNQIPHYTCSKCGCRYSEYFESED